MSSNTQMFAGVAEVTITPPSDAPTIGTIQRSTGIHDDLFARALVLNDGGQSVAIVSLDLIGMDFAQSDAVREAITQHSAVSNVVLHCTHNHSAPFNIPWSVLGPRWLSGPGRQWRDSLPSRIAELVTRASSQQQPVTLRAGRAPVHIGTNRRTLTGGTVVMKPNPSGPVVPWVDVLCLERQNGNLLSVLFSHAAHPVIIHGSSRLISAEFPGFAVQKLRKHFGGDVVPIFAQAFAADINGDPLRGGITAAEQAGAKLADAVQAAALNSTTLRSQSFAFVSASAELPLLPLPAKRVCSEVLREAEQKLITAYGTDSFTDEQLWDMQDQVELAKSQSESSAADDTQPMESKAWWMMDTVLCLRDLIRKIDQGDESPLRFEAQLLRIGDDWSMLTAAHELFAEYQLKLDTEIPAQNKMMMGYSNGCESYIPTDRELGLGGYEAATFPALDGASLRYRHRRALRPGCEKLVFQTLRSLWQKPA
jgi:neutral ceramidase